jgi:peptidoglycan/LPS O-acetylase OafA/YrhL
MVKSMPETRFVLLDGLRGVAAFGVVAYHLGPLKNWQGINSFVDFFFVLSGFVLAPAILSFDKVSRKKFLVSRVIRLYPLLIPVYLTLALVQDVPFLSKHIMGFPHTTPLAFLGSFLLIQIFWSATIPIDTPLWSLSAEWFINLFATINPLRQRFLFVVFFGLMLETFGLFINQRYSLGWGVISYTIAIGRAFAGFYLGIILRKQLRAKNHKGSGKNLFIILMIFSINFFLIGISSAFIILAAPICFFIVREVASFDESRLPKFVLIVCSYMGRISYGVYVWHAVIGKLAIPEFVWKYTPHDLHVMPKRFFYPALTVIILVVVTEISIRLVETPIRRMAKSHFQIFREN